MIQGFTNFTMGVKREKYEGIPFYMLPTRGLMTSASPAYD